jgi:hypothetical protein
MNTGIVKRLLREHCVVRATQSRKAMYEPNSAKVTIAFNNDKHKKIIPILNSLLLENN